MRKICMLVLSMLMVGQTAVLNTKAAEEEEKTKSNSQIACESNGGVWNLELGTCTDGKAESEDIDDIQLKSNSQIACEDNGGSWDLTTGTCTDGQTSLGDGDQLDGGYGIGVATVEKDNIYEASNAEEFRNTLEQIGNSQETDATIVLTADIGDNVEFVGVADKSITVKSKDNQKYALTLGGELVGNVTLDNVKIKAGTLYCNGHRTVFTENSEFAIGSLFGGAYEKDVDSVYVKINGTGVINSGSSELVITGGCYKGSVDGDLYMEIDGDIDIKASTGGNYISGGSKETRYGGDTYTGDPLYVNGDLTFILGLNNVSSSHNLCGTHNTHVYGDLNLIVKHGTFIGIDGQRENPERAIVDGNINMTVGDPNEEQPVYVTWNWGIVGAGEKIANSKKLYQVGKDVNITTYENVWCWEPGQEPGSDIGGLTAVESATVGGNVNVEVNGSHMNYIIGVDTGMYYNDPEIRGDLNIVANDTYLNSRYKDCFIYPTGDGTYIRGNVDITMNGGRANQIGAHNGTINGNVTINLTGNPTITHDVIGKSIEGDSSNDESVLNIDQGTVTIPHGIWYFKTVNIKNQSNVNLGNTEKKAFQSKIYDVNIIDSSLTTNKEAYSKGSLTMDASSLTTNGSTYITGMTRTKNSKIRFNDYVDLGFGYANDTTWLNDVLISENDTYIFGPNNFLNKIHGNATFIGGDFNIYGWLKIFGDYNGKDNNLDIYAYSGNNNYPDSTIKLEILGKTAGLTQVTLVDYNDVEQEGIPVVGQNYINALKESENTFRLANQNAKANSLYFKKLSDADTVKKAGYDMWQVAKKDEFEVIYRFKPETGSSGIPDEVMEVLPIDTDFYKPGTIVYPVAPQSTIFKTTDGIWEFVGYDAESKTINNADIEFVGTWRFVPNGTGGGTTPTEKYTVTYTDGVDDEVVFEDQVTSDLASGEKTPEFNGTPTRKGYTFVGWNPEVAETVTATATYTAQWKKDETGGGTTPTEKYTVTYTDGVEGEEVFEDQVTTDLASGEKTPEFVGTPTRKGYTFDGWNPEVAETVTATATYTAQWKKDETGGGIVVPTPTYYKVTYTDGVEGEEVFEDQVTKGLSYGEKTPAFEGTPTRAGYRFIGWEPEVAEAVKKSAVYVARWEKIEEEEEQTPPPAVEEGNTGSEAETKPDSDEVKDEVPDTGIHILSAAAAAWLASLSAVVAFLVRPKKKK